MPTQDAYDPRNDPVLRGFLLLVKETLGVEPRETLLFGSRARGDHDPYSDYDIIMVLDEVTPELRKALIRLEAEYGLETGADISTFPIAASDLPRATHEPFVINACREGVYL